MPQRVYFESRVLASAIYDAGRRQLELEFRSDFSEHDTATSLPARSRTILERALQKVDN